MSADVGQVHRQLAVADRHDVQKIPAELVARPVAPREVKPARLREVRRQQRLLHPGRRLEIPVHALVRKLQLLVLFGEAPFEADDALAGRKANAEFFALPRLRQKVIGTRFHPDDNILRFASARQHDDVRVALSILGPDALDELPAVHFGHVPVGQDHVELPALKFTPGCSAVLDGQNFMPPAFQFALEGSSGQPLVLGKQDLHDCCASRNVWSSVRSRFNSPSSVVTAASQS